MSEQKYVCDNGSVGAYAPALPFASSFSSSFNVLCRNCVTGGNMGKAKRKPRPSMPDWYWWGQDGCWFCKNKNNCNQCKANRSASKQFPKLKRKRDKIAESRFYDGLV